MYCISARMDFRDPLLVLYESCAGFVLISEISANGKDERSRPYNSLCAREPRKWSAMLRFLIITRAYTIPTI